MRALACATTTDGSAPTFIMRKNRAAPQAAKLLTKLRAQ